MPEKVTGQPDQFEQILKNICEERFGQPRGVETIWSKLALELDSTPQDKFTGQPQTDLAASDEELLPEAAPTPLPVWRRRGPFSLVAGLALATIIALAVIGLIITTNQGRSNLNTAVPGATPKTTTGPVPTITPVSSAFPDLNYPQASQLKLNPDDPWPTGKLEMDGKQIINKFALGITGNYTQVVAYYQQLLVKAGYTMDAVETIPLKCDPTSCDAPQISITSIAGSKGALHVGVTVLSPQSWFPLSLSTYMGLGNQVQPTDTIVMVTQAADNAAVKNNAGPTPTAGPAPTVRPANSDVVVEPAVPVTPPGTGGSEPVLNVTPSTSDYPDLTYPQAIELHLSDSYSWPTGKLDLAGKTVSKKIFMAVPNSIKNASSFYENRLLNAGFNIYDANGNKFVNCATPDCVIPPTNFAANKGSLYIGVQLLDSVTWQSLNPSLYQNMNSQIKATDYLAIITFASGPVNAPKTSSTLTFANLNYPHSKSITFNSSSFWPVVNPDTTGKDISERYVLTTTDDYTKVISFYRNVMNDNGFTNTPSCSKSSGCDKSVSYDNSLGAVKGTQRIEIMAFSPASWSSTNLALNMHVTGQIKSNETMILITIGY